jgi:hypothetical protein
MEEKYFAWSVKRGTYTLPQGTGSSVVCVTDVVTKLVQIIEVLVTDRGATFL